MSQVDWRQGFRIESDGTIIGTHIYDHNGDEVGYLTHFAIEFDAEKTYPKITEVQIDRKVLGGVGGTHDR